MAHDGRGAAAWRRRGSRVWGPGSAASGGGVRLTDARGGAAVGFGGSNAWRGIYRRCRGRDRVDRRDGGPRAARSASDSRRVGWRGDLVHARRALAVASGGGTRPGGGGRGAPGGA